MIDVFLWLVSHQRKQHSNCALLTKDIFWWGKHPLFASLNHFSANGHIATKGRAGCASAYTVVAMLNTQSQKATPIEE